MSTGKMMNIKIEQSIGSVYSIWTDINAKRVLYHFEGVQEVSESAYRRFTIVLDPRYDAKIVIENVKAALEAAEKGVTK